MVTHEVREKMSLYKKWLSAMTKGFLELPYRHQEELIALTGMFTDSCKKIHEEGKMIRERAINIRIDDMTEDGVYWNATGKAEGVTGSIVVKLPKASIPYIGKRISHMVYSLDGKDWYSSKSLLIEKSG